MTTRNPQKEVLEEVRQMLVRATPAQTKQLLRDIMNSALAPKDSVKYDA